MDTATANNISCVLVEDDNFTRTVLCDALAQAGIGVHGVDSATAGLEAITRNEPNVVVSDLNLGPHGPDGADLLTHVHRHYPWIALVAISVHASAELAVGIKKKLPEGVTYIVKNAITSLDGFAQQVRDSIQASHGTKIIDPDIELVELSPDQADALRLIAAGYTNAALAKHRGINLRSAEALVQRTFTSCGIDSRGETNPRVIAAQLWRDGRVVVKSDHHVAAETHHR